MKKKSLNVYFIGEVNSFHSLNEELKDFDKVELINEMERADFIVVEKRYENLISPIKFQRPLVCITEKSSSLKQKFKKNHHESRDFSQKIKDLALKILEE